MKRALVFALLGALASADDVNRPPEVGYENAPYTARFTFARVRFNPSRWGPGNYQWGLDLKWNHDYPRAEQHLLKILAETTTIDLNDEETSVLDVGDPELMRYPLAYLCEAGFLTLTDAEARALREYLLKGGFLILDDFQGAHWYNAVEQLRRVLPSGKLVELDGTHPIFDSFFRVDPYAFDTPYFRRNPPSYHGVYEDNDPKKRLMMIINYNQDVGEFWEWSDTGFIPIELTNEAYKLGVNYIIYGLTH